ncbi:hypothetical protein KEM55_007515 [Ascosphaera atra]|nr:hypothetical protein KEM55_007515 [Ascosphaera atra]
MSTHTGVRDLDALREAAYLSSGENDNFSSGDEDDEWEWKHPAGEPGYGRRSYYAGYPSSRDAYSRGTLDGGRRGVRAGYPSGHEDNYPGDSYLSPPRYSRGHLPPSESEDESDSEEDDDDSDSFIGGHSGRSSAAARRPTSVRPNLEDETESEDEGPLLYGRAPYLMPMGMQAGPAPRAQPFFPPRGMRHRQRYPSSAYEADDSDEDDYDDEEDLHPYAVRPGFGPFARPPPIPAAGFGYGYPLRGY